MPPVLLVEDRDSLRAMLRSTLEAEGFAVEEAADGKRAAKLLAGGRFLAVVTDLKLPGADGHQVLEAAREADPNLPVIVMSAYGTIEDAVGAMKRGAWDFLAKPVEPDHLLLLLRRAVERRQLLEENLLLKEEFAERLGFPRILGDAPALHEVTRQVQKAAPTDATVLLLGESGTGKELFARAIHHLSPRRAGPFVAINCAAIPDTLLENELFGHEKGAYTGASAARAGRIELADRGTLFLDEVGELGPGVQAKLLRVLQERTFERVGGNRTISVNLRIVAATNRDLRKAAREGGFREDLYFRLAVVSVRVPALRERREDIPVLAGHFLERFGKELGKEQLKLSGSSLDALVAYAWPGNVRELENAIERAAILADGPLLEPQHLSLSAPHPAEDDLDAFARAVGLEGGLDAASERARAMVERLMIKRALAEAGGNKVRAAQRLDVNYKRLLARVRELGLEEDSLV
jgi:DNA-binding NtrC family response regulator